MTSKLFFTSIIILFSITAFCQEITMFPGFWSEKYYQDDTRISKYEVGQLMLQDQEANEYWRKSKSHMTIGYVALGAEIGFLVWQSSKASSGESQVGPLIGVVGSGIIAIGYFLSSGKLKEKAILTYNQSADMGASFKLELGTTKNGLGLACTF